MKKFRSRVHVATVAVPKSKSVVVCMPARTGEKAETDRLYVNDENTEWIDFVEKSECVPGKPNQHRPER